jgi:hypothetical protein
MAANHTVLSHVFSFVWLVKKNHRLSESVTLVRPSVMGQTRRIFGTFVTDFVRLDFRDSIRYGRTVGAAPVPLVAGVPEIPF